jgi:ADP-ribose pyrophosphatase YjhB (NUDIX family)
LSITNVDIPPVPAAVPIARTNIPPERVVVAVVLEWRGRIALFRRSQQHSHDGGLWHCISGYVEPGVTPERQVMDELSEEAGLQAEDLGYLQHGPELVLTDASGASWRVFTFRAMTNIRRLRLNWEHDSYRWTSPHKWRRFTNRVSWLDEVLRATGYLPPAPRWTRGLVRAVAECPVRNAPRQ